MVNKKHNRFSNEEDEKSSIDEEEQIFDEKELALESRELIQQQKKALQSFENSLLASGHIFSEWANFNKSFCARAVNRLEKAQEGGSFEKQAEEVGKAAMENIRDYFESFAKFGHEASTLAGNSVKKNMKKYKEY